MAYVFNKINDLMAGEQNQPQATNIFAEGQGGQDPSQGGEGSAPGQQQVKTSTEGDLSGGGGGSGTASEKMPQDMKKQDTRVLKRNVGKVSTPDFTGRIQENLTKADQDLQSESDAYMQNAQTNAGTYSVDDQTLDKAVSGDQEASQRVTGALQAAPVDYEDFTPETQTNFNDVQDLSSSQGLQRLLKNEARGRLSAKELEFDRGILERTPEFLKIREMLKGQQSTLSQKAADLSAKNTETAQGQIDAAIEAARAGAESGLTGRRDDLIKANEAEAAAINEKRKQLQAAGIPKEVQDQILGIRSDLAAEYDDKLRMDELLMQQGINPADYLSWGGEVGMADMVDDSEAAKFNQILQLLGKGGDTWTAGQGAGSDFTLDAAKVRDAIVSGAQTERTNLDNTMKGEQKTLLDAIRGRINTENDARQKAYDDYKAMTIQKLKDANQGMNWDLVDFNQFFAGPGKALTFENVINAQEASRLNELSKLLGAPASNYKGGSIGDFTRADTNAIQAYLNSLKHQSGGPGTPISNNANPVTQGDSNHLTGTVQAGTQKGPNNGDPTNTIKQIITNPVGTTKAHMPKKPKKRW